MKAQSLSKLLQYLALPFMAVGLFEKPLGLNEWTHWILLLIAAALLWSGVWVQQRAKKRGESIAIPNAQQRRNRLILCSISLILTTLTSPFWLPYLGSRLPMPQLIAVSIISCVIAFIALFFAARRWSKD
jgi:hypothetical protein